MQAVLIAAVLTALPFGGKVAPAVNWQGKPLGELTRQARPPAVLEPGLTRVYVPGRDPKKIQESRDPLQTYAIVRTYDSRHVAWYTPYLIVGDRYREIPLDFSQTQEGWVPGQGRWVPPPAAAKTDADQSFGPSGASMKDRRPPKPQFNGSMRWPAYEDADNIVFHHWQQTTHRHKPVVFEPSPLARKLLAAGTWHWPKEVPVDLSRTRLPGQAATAKHDPRR